ncbi:MAG TPA: hypothetical protein VMW29_02280, partial [Candidatus Bathyarchaeia archaeon]|nr:hypothetical protein [Candidatus Bathyarchaeia archaeon]
MASFKKEFLQHGEFECSKELLERARERCIKVIKNNFISGAFLAGPKIHRDWWATDNLSASLALVDLGFSKQVASVIDFFLRYQNEDGQIPLRVESSSHSLRFFGINKKHLQLKPIY